MTCKNQKHLTQIFEDLKLCSPRKKALGRFILRRKNKEYFLMSQRVGIISLYYQNYNMGGLLQAYALQKAIEAKEFSAEQICYKYKATNIDHSQGHPRNVFYDKGIIHGCIKLLGKIINKVALKTIGKLEEPKIKKRIQKYNEFANQIPHSDQVYTAANIDEVRKNYDTFVCGGDQIWNDWGRKHEKDSLKVFTLQFVNCEKRKFSYSASTGSAIISEEQLRKLEPGISELNMVSVREKSSVSSIQKIARADVHVMPDPVLLLGVEQWEKMCCEYSELKEKYPYIFCYFLGSDSTIKKSAQKFCHKVGIKALVLTYIHNKFEIKELFNGDIRDYTSGPVEFVDLIRNSEAILTDSYHAVVFSIIFHKPFYVFKRSTVVGNGTMNTRILDFLEEYGLENRLVTVNDLEGKKEIEKIDYTHVDEVRKKKTEQADIFLQTSLGL